MWKLIHFEGAMLYMISYDLVTPGQQYEKLHQRITQLGGKKILKSQWILENSATADAIWKDLRPITDGNDRLLVSELASNAQWAKNGLLIPDAEMERLLKGARC